VKRALGAGHGDGDGEGDGDGVGVGLDDGDADAEAEAVGDGDGDGVGDGEGDGDGVGVGGGFGGFGIVTMSAVAVAPSVRSGPPVNGRSSGVRSEKWPVTATTTRFAGTEPSAQDGEQLIATSAGVIVTNEPAASPVAAHMIRLVVASHGCPARYDVGFSAASNAPVRAAFVIVIWEWNSRPRSIAAASSRRMTGRISASSTRLWP
jgi:hypothetical protein